MRSNGPLANKKVAMGGHGWPGGLVASWPRPRGNRPRPADGASCPANRQKPATHYGTPHNRLGRNPTRAQRGPLTEQERRRGC